MTRRKLCRLLREGIKDEAEADPFYTELIREVRQEGLPSDVLAKIRLIKGDERRHLDRLKAFERRFCS